MIKMVPSPGLKTGTVIVCSTVSIQKTALISKAWAFGRLGSGSSLSFPSRKAILSVPPPNSGLGGLGFLRPAGFVDIKMAIVEMIFCALTILLRIEFGLSNMSCVIVPALMKGVRSCGIRAVPWLVAVWLGNFIGFVVFPGATVVNGVISTEFMIGGPSTANENPCASIVVPCGMDPMRARVGPSTGESVGGTFIHSPGST